MAATKRRAVPKAEIAKTPIEPAYMAKPHHLRTVHERMEVGRALRVTCPREYHAGWNPAADRRDPVELVLAAEQGRLEGLLPIRHGRMAASPFTFFRGAASIMASDLSATASTGYTVQACGDCHLLNFGAFATPERRIIFDINDFDETFPAPWEWDLKRLAASFVVASRANGHRPDDARAAARTVARAYGAHMAELAGMRALDVWYSYLDWEKVIEQTEDQVLRKRRAQVLGKAIQRNASVEFVKLAHFVDGKPRIKDQPPLIYHRSELEDPEFNEIISTNIVRYRESLSPDRRVLFDRYELADIAVKVVGVGSVGTLCAVALFFAAEGDALFLQVKQVTPSVLEPYVGHSPFGSDGERVVFGQRLMQAASDVFLGHIVGARGIHYYVRQLRDVKIRPLVELYTPANMLDFAGSCATALARAHARSGDPAIISGYIGKGGIFGNAIADFAVAYADQNDRDHAALVEAVRGGRLEAVFDE